MTNKSRNDITEVSKDRDNARTGTSRSNREENREGAKVVELPGGRRFTRVPSTALGATGSKLALPKKKGFYRQWISDEIDGHLQNYVNLGFVPATEEHTGEMVAPRAGGVRKNNTQYMMYAMEIDEREFEELKNSNKLQNPAEAARALDEQWLKGQHNSELNTYNPINNSTKEL